MFKEKKKKQKKNRLLSTGAWAPSFCAVVAPVWDSTEKPASTAFTPPSRVCEGLQNEKPGPGSSSPLPTVKKTPPSPCPDSPSGLRLAVLPTNHQSWVQNPCYFFVLTVMVISLVCRCNESTSWRKTELYSVRGRYQKNIWDVWDALNALVYIEQWAVDSRAFHVHFAELTLGLQREAFVTWT